jgi:uncharacterized protein (DUF1501 family)
LSALILDLHERGLNNDVSVVLWGEFGRTPKINKSNSRDHWPSCYTVLLAGGGVKRGYRYGSSDRFGAYPASGAVRPDDLAATIFSLMGIDPSTEMHDGLGRPFAISSGQVIHDVIA